MDLFQDLTAAVSQGAVPFIIAGILLLGAAKKVPVYEVFVEGAKEGFEVAVKIIPYLVAILTVVGMVRAAGLLDLMGRVLGPVVRFIGVPPEVLPMAFIRPLSGSGADGVLGEMITVADGAAPVVDQLAPTTAAVMAGSTETTFYVLAVYFGSVGIRRIRHALWAGLCADLAGVLAACWLTNLLLF
jgi:spore maturation protein B